MLVDIIKKVHKSTKRDYLSHFTQDKPRNSTIAKKYGKDFFDGDRKYGYGGYKYDGRWIPVAEKIIKGYGITNQSSVLDIGCGKGHLAWEIEKLSNADVWGCDCSRYALRNTPLKKTFLFEAGKQSLSERGGDYDFIMSINTLHNLILPKLKQAIQQISQHSKKSYIVVESYRDEKELYNLECWSLTGEQFLKPQEWEFLFNEWGYKGDWEFIFFE